MKRFFALLVGVLFFVTVRGNEQDISGVVVAVLDGNTLEIKSDTETVKVMLYGIDSPELGQEYGEEARLFLEKKLLKKCVTVKIQGMDRKGNYLGVVILKKDIDPRVDLLKNGLAWTAEKDPLPALEQYKTSAKQKGVGLWQQQEPTPPWTFRRQQSMIRPKSS